MLCLTRRFKLPHNLLTLSAQMMRIFNSVVETFMSTLIGIRCYSLYRLDVTAKFVRHHDAGRTELLDQS